MSITISAIITTYNRPLQLLEALGSVLNQTLIPDQIVIVNDGLYFEEFNQIKCTKNLHFHQNIKPMGGNFSRNKGAELSTGDILMFLDDDDTWELNKVKDQIEILSSDPEAGLVYTGKKFVYSSDRNKVIRTNKPKIEGYIFKKLLFSNILGSTSCVAIRKDVFYQAGKFDENLKALQDYDLWLRCVRISKVRHDNGINLRYTLHNNTAQVSKNIQAKIDSINYIKEKYMVDFKQLSSLEKRKYLARFDYSIAKTLKLKKERKYIAYLIKSLFKYPDLRKLVLLFN